MDSAATTQAWLRKPRSVRDLLGRFGYEYRARLAELGPALDSPVRWGVDASGRCWYWLEPRRSAPALERALGALDLEVKPDPLTVPAATSPEPPAVPEPEGKPMAETRGRPRGRYVDAQACNARAAELGLSHAAIAERLGVSKSAVTNALTLRARVSGKRGGKLAAALELEGGADAVLLSVADSEAVDAFRAALAADRAEGADNA